MCNSSTPSPYQLPADAQSAPVGDQDPDVSGVRPKQSSSGSKRKLEYPPAPAPLPVAVIDNHTHFNFRDGLVEVSAPEAMDVAESVGVKAVVQVGCDLESSRFTVEAVNADARLLGAVAIHPNDAPRYAARGELESALAEIEEMAQHPRIRAIGETGLDFFRTDGDEDLAQQRYSFRRHIDIAKRLGLALQIHDRDAHSEVVKVLKEEGAPERVIFHCFSADAELAKICNENGWFMSFAGTVTFKNAAGIREGLAVAERELIMVETDSPFLTPHPYRGQPNASYMIPYTVRGMAELTGIELSELGQLLCDNTEKAYGSWE
ncbi:TatD family hydrolase [Pseudarthrobacter sp. J1763]|uniref:TatD family hydrolase n=1 Tax=Pseudarthrobacter sp. J1763 TaxID=3420445 RepID=UPI003D26B7E0